MKPGQESVVLDYEYYWREKDESGEGAKIRRDIVRYQVTVTCLEGGKLPDRGKGAADEEDTEDQSR